MYWCILNDGLLRCSRGKSGSPLVEFAQLPTTKMSAAQLPYCFDENVIVEHGTTSAIDVIPRTCALYACHLDQEICHHQQQQRERAPQFPSDTDFTL